MRLLLSLLLLAQLPAGSLANTGAEIVCGQMISQDTVLTQDLVCPSGTMFAIIIGASGITLDLGGYTISGQAPGIGVYADGYGGFTIRNGAVEGFNDAVFLTNTHDVIVEHLWIKELTDADPGHLIRGVNIYQSQRVTVKDSFFEYLVEFHREAVEIYESDVIVSDIEVRGGGVGVNFSFAGDCDPVNRPSNGVVRNSRFVGFRGMGVLVQCSSDAWITGNVFAPGTGLGVVADGPFPGSVTGTLVEANMIAGQYLGVEIGGASDVTVSDNIVHDSVYGIALWPSLGCSTPETGWDCFYPSASVVSDNQTFDNTTDLSHDTSSLGNTWVRNECQTKDGSEIPACLPPTAVLTADYPSGKPGSFFTIEGFNFTANSTVTVTINSVPLGTVAADVAGTLGFLLDTAEADIGFYTVTATTPDAGSSTSFSLSVQNRIHEQDGSGTVFLVPGDIAIGTIYLPLVLR